MITFLRGAFRLRTSDGHWTREEWARRLARNAAQLLMGNVAASVLTTVSLVLVARGLTSMQFGRFSMLIAYVAVVDGLLNFQSWQALIHFGSKAREAGDTQSLRSLLRLGFLLDVLPAIVAGIIAVAGVQIFGDRLELTGDVAIAAACYGGTILLRVTGAATAALRLFDRFDISAAHVTLHASVRLALIVAAYLNDASMAAYIYAWALAELCGNGFLIVAAQRIAAAHGCSFVHFSSAVLRGAPGGFWRFVFTSNVHSSLKLTIKEGDVLVVGAIAGPLAAGMYRVSRQVASAAGRLITPLYQSVYPELARAVCNGDMRTFDRVILRSAGMAGALFLVGTLCFAICGGYLLQLVFGSQYQGAYWPTVFQLLAATISMATFPLHPALLALGAPGKSLFNLTVGVLVFAVAIACTVPQHGALGASISYLLYYAVWAILMSFEVLRQRRAVSAGLRPVGTGNEATP